MKKRGRNFAGKVCGDPRQLAAAKRQAYGEAWSGIVANARSLVSRLLPEEQQTFSDRLRDAITTLAECRGGLDEWSVIVGTILQIEALGRVGVIKTGCAELVDEAQRTVEAAMGRHKATGSNVLRPIEITSLTDLADNWDLILGAVTVGELNKSSEIAMRKRSQALAKGEQKAMVEA